MSKFIVVFPLSLMTIFLKQSPIVELLFSSDKQEMTVRVVPDEKNEDESIYFRANGMEPEWRLTISTEQIEFTSATKGYEKIITEHDEPVKVVNSNVKKYDVQNKDFHMIIELTQIECGNTNSRERFPYSTRVSIFRGKEKEPVIFNGCGLYITDKRLEAKWILHQIKNDTITAAQFNDTIPFVEISARGNSFSGYGGCNNITGRIFSERNLLRFTDMIVSKSSCAVIAKEKEFIDALQFSTHFKIEENKLILSNPGGMTLTFLRP